MRESFSIAEIAVIVGMFAVLLTIFGYIVLTSSTSQTVIVCEAGDIECMYGTEIGENES